MTKYTEDGLMIRKAPQIKKLRMSDGASHTFKAKKAFATPAWVIIIEGGNEAERINMGYVESIVWAE